MEVSGVNKSELIDAVTDRVAVDRKTVTSAVDVLLETVTRTVANGERVVLTGFGSFEKKDKPARTGRNPATGAAIKLKKTSVPRFKAGAGFSDVVSGAKKLPKLRPATKPAAGTGRTTGRAGKGSAAGAAAVTGAARSGARPATTATPPPATSATKSAPTATAAARSAPSKTTTSRATRPAPAPPAGTATAGRTTAQQGTEQDCRCQDRGQRPGSHAHSRQDRRGNDLNGADGRPEVAGQEELSRG
jgi:DNA-binding protein HU-beta